MAKLGLERLGFKQEEIIELMDPSWDLLHNTIMDLTAKIFDDFKNGLNTLLFVYFAGHGQQEASNQILVLNEEKKYPLEKMLRTLAKNEKGYVVSVFDCCREQAPAEIMRGGSYEEEKKKEATIEDSGFFLLDIIENISVTSKMRYVAFYGCEPS